jgi:hypothetical protein
MSDFCITNTGMHELDHEKTASSRLQDLSLSTRPTSSSISDVERTAELVLVPLLKLSKRYLWLS